MNPALWPHPVNDPYYRPASRQPGELLTPAEAEYLDRTYPAGSRPKARPGAPLSTEGLYRMAVNTNRFHAGVILGWSLLVTLLALVGGLTLHSTWAAYHLSRSGRGPVACIVCYPELYLPAAFVLITWVQAAWLSLFYRASFTNSTPIALGLGSAFVALAHAGVVRRWHWAVRLAGYAGVIGVGAGLISAFGS
jgi:hypothetical protein